MIQPHNWREIFSLTHKEMKPGHSGKAIRLLMLVFSLYLGLFVFDLPDVYICLCFSPSVQCSWDQNEAWVQDGRGPNNRVQEGIGSARWAHCLFLCEAPRAADNAELMEGSFANGFAVVINQWTCGTTTANWCGRGTEEQPVFYVIVEIHCWG